KARRYTKNDLYEKDLRVSSRLRGRGSDTPGPERTSQRFVLSSACEGSHELAVQGRADALRLRRTGQGQEDGVERREESAGAEASAVGQERRSDFLLPHRRREGGGGRREGAGRRLSRSERQERQGLGRRRGAGEEAPSGRDAGRDQGGQGVRR